MNLKNSKIVSSKNLKEFFPELNEIIELSDHQIQIEYKKISLSIIGNGNILSKKKKIILNIIFLNQKKTKI